MTFRAVFSSLAVLALVGAAGCSANTPESGQSEQNAVERGPIGKADLWGSCAGASQQQAGGGDYCGGESTGNCWCDDLCADFGDCCEDKEEVCGAACLDPEDPTVHYVSEDPEKCKVIRFFCEPGQEYFGGECGCGCVESAPSNDGACGGLLGLGCDEGEFCSYAPEAQCGAADQMGTCAIKPDACIQIYKPVCGCDGKTYSNGCTAASAGMSVVSEGECASPEVPNNCPPEGCGEGSYCSFCWGSMQCIPEGAVC